MSKLGEYDCDGPCEEQGAWLEGVLRDVRDSSPERQAAKIRAAAFREAAEIIDGAWWRFRTFSEATAELRIRASEIERGEEERR